MTRGAWRAAGIFMLVVFLLSAVVQFDDPDPLPWIAVYGLAAGLCAASLAGRGSRVAPVLLMLVALAAAAPLAPRVLGRAGIGDVFGSMKATDPLVEETRELLGLLIVAAWMAVLAWRGRAAQPRPDPRGEK
jgi:hypothetical protein